MSEVSYYSEISRDIVELVITELQDRGGFDHWWDEIDDDIKTEIATELISDVYQYLVSRC